MNSLENRQKNTEKLNDDLYNFCKKADLKKIENILSNNNNIFSNYIIDEAIRIVIRNYNQENKEFLKTLSYLLKFNTDINFKNESQNYATILMEAACSEKIEILETILNFFDVKKNTKIENSINNKSNNLIINKSSGSNENQKNKNIQNLNTNLTANIINNNILDLNVKDSDGQTVLHKIINSSTLDENYKITSLKKLIQKGGDVNEENILGYTPLALTLLMGNSYLSEYLINSGANINHIIAANNENMLHCAVRGKNPSIIVLLNTVDLKHKNKHGETPMDLANNLKLLSFKDFFNKIDTENSEINLNNKIISSMLPINDIINKNYSQVLLHLEELKSCFQINNSEMRFIWNTLLAEYFKFFENELLEENLNNQILVDSNNNLKSLTNNNFNNNLVNNITNNQQQENFNSSNLNVNISNINFANINVKTNNSNKYISKKNRKSSNASNNTTNNNTNMNNSNLIILNENTNNNILTNKNRQYFLEKFIDCLNKNEKSQSDSEHKKIFFYNSGLFWFKLGNYGKCIEQLLNCLKINSKKEDFLFFTNSSFLFINIFQNMQEFTLANKIIENLETYISNYLQNNNSINKTNTKSLNNTVNASGSVSINDENKNLLNSPNRKSLISLYNQREIINKNNSNEELNCILNIFKSLNFLYEEKIDDCKKFLKEYKRLWNILIIKDAFPMLDTLKKIYHVVKIRIHYLNNAINKSLKHSNLLANFTSKNDQENLNLQICRFNNFGILNLKQKKYSLAQFNFKYALSILKKYSNYFNFNTNISQLGDFILFNLGLSYFFEKKYEECYKTLKKINGKIANNPFYFYRLGLSCLEMELNSIKEKTDENSYNDILEKFVVKNSQYNPTSNVNNIIDYSDKKSANSSPENKKINIINNNNNNFNNDLEAESSLLEKIKKQNSSDSVYSGNQILNSLYIMKNTNNLFLESEKILEAIQYFTTVINLIKNFENLQYQKEFFEVSEFYNLNNYNKNNDNISEKSSSNMTDNFLNFDKIKNFPKFSSKSNTSILISSYLNLLFCFSLKNRWTEMLFFISDLEASNLPIKDINYTIDNYKIEAYMGLNQFYKVIELLKKNMLNGNYTYNCLDLKGSFFSKVYGNVSAEINFKIALYSNVIKLNFLNNNILEVEKGIVKIIGLFNMNLNLNQNIENISLPSYLINILIYYYLLKENHETAIYLIKKRRLPAGSFGFLVGNTSKSVK